MQFLLLTRHIVKNPGMNTGVVEGYAVPAGFLTMCLVSKRNCIPYNSTCVHSKVF
jgi:hypothetical protein